MKSMRQTLTICLLAILAISTMGALGARINRFEVPLSVMLDGTTVDIRLTVDVLNNELNVTAESANQSASIEVGEVRYLGRVNLEPVPTPTAPAATTAEDLTALDAEATEESYEDLVRKNRTLRGELVYLAGVIDNVANGLDDGDKRLGVLFEEGEYSEWDWEKAAYVDYSGDLRFVAGDEIEVWGIVRDVEDDFMGTPHPVLEAVHVELLSTDPTVPEQCVASKNAAATASDVESLRESAVMAATIQDLLRYFDSCAGAVVEFVGEISAVEYDSNQEVLDIRVGESRGLWDWYDNNIMAEYEGEESLMEEDEVIVLGQIHERYDESSYTIDGWDSIDLRITVLDIVIDD